METNIILEKIKKIKIQIMGYRILPFLVAACLILFVALHHGISGDIKLYIILGVIVIGILVVSHGESKIQELKYKCNDLYMIALGTMIDYPHYEPERGFEQLEVATFGIIKLGKMYNSENYFQGIYRGVSARMADVVIYGDSNNDDNCHIVNFFDGRIYEFRCEKIAVQNLKVFSRGYDSRLNISDYRVDVDSLLFNDNYDVYAPEPSEAAEILTNEMMEHLLILQNRYKSIGFRFGEGKVFVAINGLKIYYGDHLEKGQQSVEFAILKEEINIIIDLIESLGLVNEETQEKNDE